MTIANSRGLAISLPSSELANIKVESSVSDISDVLASPISPALHSSLTLLTEYAETAGVPVKCVARPELFTDGKSLEWLSDRLASFTDHIHLSDGGTIKTIPGLRTHLFLYSRSKLDSLMRLEELISRAPEIVGGLTSQINSSLHFAFGENEVMPPPLLMRRATADSRKSASLWEFYGNIHSIEDSVGQIVKRGRARLSRMKSSTSLVFFSVSAISLRDARFARLLLDFVLDAFFHPTSLLVIQLEDSSNERQQLHDGLSAMFGAFGNLGASLPRAAIGNIILVTGELGETHPLFSRMKFDVFIHPSIEFWRYTTSFFERANSVTVINDLELANETGPSGRRARIGFNFLPSAYADVFGREVEAVGATLK